MKGAFVTCCLYIRHLIYNSIKYSINSMFTLISLVLVLFFYLDVKDEILKYEILKYIFLCLILVY